MMELMVLLDDRELLISWTVRREQWRKAVRGCAHEMLTDGHTRHKCSRRKNVHRPDAHSVLTAANYCLKNIRD